MIRFNDMMSFKDLMGQGPSIGSNTTSSQDCQCDTSSGQASTPAPQSLPEIPLGNSYGSNPAFTMPADPGISIMQDNQLQQNAISPSALSNQGTIRSVFGDENPGKFTRTIGKAHIASMPAQDMSAQTAMGDTYGNSMGYGRAQKPPKEVQTPITPTYDLNNL